MLSVVGVLLCRALAVARLGVEINADNEVINRALSTLLVILDVLKEVLFAGIVTILKLIIFLS